MKYIYNQTIQRVHIGNIIWGLVAITVVIFVGLFLFRPDIIIMGL